MNAWTEEDVVQAAVTWWKRHRPKGWSKMSHLYNPTVNTTTPAEKRLAIAVSKLVRKGPGKWR